MLIKRIRGWELKERQATPESVYRNRREILRGLDVGTIGVGAAAVGLLPQGVMAATPDPSAGLYPMKQNPKYKLDRPLTAEDLVTKYNNYYEFGSQKQIWREAQGLQVLTTTAA